MPETRLNTFEQILAILCFDEVYDIGARIPVTDPIRGGRPRRYPGWVYVVYGALAKLFRSERVAAEEIRDPRTWEAIRWAGFERYPDRPDMWAPAEPMSRGTYRWMKVRHCVPDEFLKEIADVHQNHAAAQAHEMGLMNDDGQGSLTHPAKHRTCYADGKVVKPRYKNPATRRLRWDPATGEILPYKYDPDASDYVTGGGELVYGLNFILAHTRRSERNERVILGVKHAPRVGGEARWGLELLDELLPLYPFAQAVLYDGAFRGVHIRKIQRTYGVVVLAPLTTSDGKKVKKVKDRHYGPALVRRPDGTVEVVQVHLRNGAPNLVVLTVEGEKRLFALRRTKTERRSNATEWRHYNVYEVAPENGGGEIRLPLFQTAEQRQAKFNVEENLRAIPPDDPDYKRLYPLRSDAESHHRKLDDSLIREWAPSVGRPRQTWDMFLWAIKENAVALATFRAREQTHLQAA